ncbi:MAG TPA: hypothetical protein VFE46_10810 [Pirellulales bacterium]|nr:hypothetical protein [Pirellulales bacterium]
MTTGSAIQKADGAGGLTAATPGTDFVAPGTIVIHKTDGTSDSSKTSLDAAKTAAIAGQKISVGPGAYSATASILKNGVAWDFAAGASVSVTSDTVELFGDGGEAIVCKITGHGDFTSQVVTTDFGSNNLIHIQNANTDIYLEGHSFTMHGSSDANCSVLLQEAGRVRLHGNVLSDGGTDYTIWWKNGDLYAEGDSAGGPSTYCVFDSQVDAAPTSTPDGQIGNAYLNYKHITGNIGVANPGLDTSAAAWIQASLIDGGDIYDQSGNNKIYIESEKGYGTIQSTSGTGLCYITLQKHSADASGGAFPQFIGWHTGTLRYWVNHVDPNGFGGDASAGGSIVIFGGAADLIFGDYTGTSTSVGIKVKGGALNLWNLFGLDVSANSSTDAITVSGGVCSILSGSFISNSGKNDFVQSSGTLTVASGVSGSGAGNAWKTSGTVSKQPIWGVTPSTTFASNALGLTYPASGTVVVQGGALGTPGSATLTNATGLPNAGLLNSSLTIAGHSVSLGGTQAISIGDLTSGAIADGSTATTQTFGDNSTKPATTAYVDRVIGSVTFARSAGTAYIVTGTSAAATFGTTNPVFTCPATGTYLLNCRLRINDNSTADDYTMTYKLRKTSGTPSDIANTQDTYAVDAIANGLNFNWGNYVTTTRPATTALTAGDTITVFVSQDVPDGTTTVEEVDITAQRIQ